MTETVKRLKYVFTSKMQENVTVLRKSMSFKSLLLIIAKVILSNIIVFKKPVQILYEYIRGFFHVIIKTKLF